MGKIGKYEILRKIGTGGFGTVYEALDPLIERRVALKTCEVADPEMRARFFQEARLGGSLRHRNITTVFDFGVEGDTAFIVQELLDGEDLDRTIGRRPGLSLLEKLRILLGGAYGLEYAHNAGIVHGDVKPGNIRVLEDGTVKLMDFGIARSIRVEAGHTRTGVQIGTLAYLAPERILEQPVDARSDVFSFGVVAYELLSGRRPFPGDTQEDLFDQIVHDEAAALETVAPEVPPMLAAIVGRAMRKNPAGRYAAMEGMRKDLLAVHYSLFHGPAPAEIPPAVETSPSVSPTTRELWDPPPPPASVPPEPTAPAGPPALEVRRAVPRSRAFYAAAAASVLLSVVFTLVVVRAIGRIPTREAGAVSPEIPVANPRAAEATPPRHIPPAQEPSSAHAQKPAPQASATTSPEAALVGERNRPASRAMRGPVALPPSPRPVAGGASRWTRAAEEPGLSADTRAAIYVSGAWERYRAGDPETAQRLLGSAFGWRSDLKLDPGRYDPDFLRLADRARLARRNAL